MNRLLPEQRANIIQLRKAGFSLDAISRKTNINRNVVWYYVRRFDRNRELDPAEIKRKRQEHLRVVNQGRRERRSAIEQQRRDNASALWQRFSDNYRTLLTPVKGAISETAVLLRLLLLGVRVYSGICDGSDDWLACLGEQSRRVQVKTVYYRGATPLIRTSKNNRSRYTKADCDMLIGYSLVEDCCYILPVHEAKERSTSLRESHRDNWGLLFGGMT